jgi:UDP-N-acetylmuramoyl-tripeptide--D-alanyl-D-alanine ligase
MQDLANYHRKQLPATVIAITGTNGKTTTKELIAAALSSQYPTLYTRGNLNNHIGVPLTLLQLKSKHQYAVIEMGANHPGEIAALCRIAEPDFGLITNIGKAHLEGFGSFEGVIRTKSELYAYLQKKGGCVFAHHDNLILSSLYTSVPRIYYGTSASDFICGRITSATPVLTLEWQKAGAIHRLTTQLVGAYNFENVLAAICTAVYFGVNSENINRAMREYYPNNHRSQNMQTAKNHLIVDTYNANPSSMAAALENFCALPVSPKVIILGEMRELGKYSVEEHQKIIALLQESGIERVFLVGESFKTLSPTLPDWKVFDTTGQLKTCLQTHPLSGYHILLKGSRSNRLEELIASL